MALEAVVFPQEYPFVYGSNTTKLDSFLNYDSNFIEDNYNSSNVSVDFVPQDFPNNCGDWNSSAFNDLHISETSIEIAAAAAGDSSSSDQFQLQHLDASAAVPHARPKRRRAKMRKNNEEIENQRMTHIAIERNRRKLMNEYLSVLRSLMPESYVQRGDQASIIGGAINFVKELEHKLQFLGGQKGKEASKSCREITSFMPFTEFFTFPQYSTSSSSNGSSEYDSAAAAVGEVQSAVADIEVTMVESHANVKIRSKRRPKQVLKLASGIHSLHLTILHLNVTSIEEIVLFSISVKVEDECNLGSVDEIAAAVHQLLERIQQEAVI